MFRDVRTLMRAIFRRRNPADVAVDLLEKGSEATRAKILSQCLEYLYGKPVQPVTARNAENDDASFDFICHIPRPKYPDPEPNAIATRGKVPTTQEDEHE